MPAQISAVIDEYTRAVIGYDITPAPVPAEHLHELLAQPPLLARLRGHARDDAARGCRVRGPERYLRSQRARRASAIVGRAS